MAVAIVRPKRAESPERWQAALQRATDHALDVFAVAGMPDTFAVTSSSDPSIVYLTTATTCGCPAALADDAVCLHRAAVRAALGLLEAAAAADHVPATIDCPDCRGRGWVYVGDDTHWPDRVACRRCAGEGQVAVWIRQAPSTVAPVSLSAD